MAQQPPEQIGLDRQTALLKEYEMCQQEATGTANWIWAATTMFLAAWVAALGMVADNDKSESGVIWLLVGVATVAKIRLISFLARSFKVRQYMFIRQRQIEPWLGMFKSRAIHISDMRRTEQADALRALPEHDRDVVIDFIEQANDVRSLRVEFLAISLYWLPGLFLGREGRGTLYKLSLLVAAV